MAPRCVSNGFRFTLDGSGGGIRIFGEDYGAKILTMPFGGFLTLGFLIAAMQYALKKSAKKKQLEAELEAEEAREYDEEQDDYYYTDSAPLRCW